jgi:hypothetical protein
MGQETKMTPDEYIKLAIKTESPNFQMISPRLLHGTMGVDTESGELTDSLKKHMFYGKPLDLVNINEEIGDLLWYIALICNECNFSFEDIMKRNIDKLKARYPEKFTSEKALNRDLETERKILER